MKVLEEEHQTIGRLITTATDVDKDHGDSTILVVDQKAQAIKKEERTELDEEKGEASKAPVREKEEGVEEEDTAESDKEETTTAVGAPDKQQGVKATQNIFPNAFYCPISKTLMKDPVATPDGLSYERSAIAVQERSSSGDLYPNRALKSIIDEAVEMTDDSLLAGMKRFTNSVCQNISLLVDSTAANNNPECLPPLPEAYHCPITFGLMHDPVIDPEGNTFDRIAVENWIHAHGTSPITRTKMSIKDLYPNLAVAELLKEEMNRSDESMHPAIKVWKDEAPPERLDPSGLVQQTTSTNEERISTRIRNERIRNERIRAVLCFIFFCTALILAVFQGGLRLFIIAFVLLAVCSQNNRSTHRY